MNPFVILLALLLIVLVSCTNYDAFAKCLTEKGVTMYGAFWCPHCTRQKALFGSSIEYVKYIECSLPDKSGQTEICKKADIQGYPTWEFADGSRVPGELALEQLSIRTGCKLQP